MRLKAKRIMEKFESSGRAVQDFMKEQAHELMLKQELRKLREEDMRKQAERQKRLENIHKLKVIDGEKTSDNRIKIVKDRDNALVQIRYLSSVKNQLEKEEIQRTLSKWAHSGFSTSRAKLQTVGGAAAAHTVSSSPLMGSQSIADFQAQLLRTGVKKPKKGEDGQDGNGGK